MSREQNTAPQHGEREQFRQGRRRGDTTATFRPGELLLCPGWLSVPGYNGPCGCSFSGERAMPHTRVIIRQRRGLMADLQAAGTLLRCHKCGSALEKWIIRETL